MEEIWATRHTRVGPNSQMSFEMLSHMTNVGYSNWQIPSDWLYPKFTVFATLIAYVWCSPSNLRVSANSVVLPRYCVRNTGNEPYISKYGIIAQRLRRNDTQKRCEWPSVGRYKSVASESFHAAPYRGRNIGMMSPL